MELRGQFEFEPSGFFVVRTPLLPWDELESWSKGLRAATASTEELSAALATDRSNLRERLRTAMLRPEVREAVFVASPHLEAGLETWLQEPESVRGRGIELALARYYERMCARATPFGLCAGFSVGETGPRTRLVLAERAKYRRHTRPDTEYLGALIRILEQRTELRRQLTFRPNSTLYEAGGRLRYVERRYSEKGFSDCVVSAEKNDGLAMTLERAAGGQRMEALAEALADGEISREEALGFIEELIASQILVPDLPSQVTGPEPLPALLASLQILGAPAVETREKLERLQCDLAVMDQAGIGRPTQVYRDLAAQLEPIPSKADLTTMFQVDMVKPALQATLDQVALTEIGRGVELLRHVSRRFRSTEIARFRETFFARYEYREIPLVEALDEECGLPFPVPDESGTLNGAPWRRRGFNQWSAVNDWMLRKLTQALSSGATEIKLDPKEMESQGDKNLPPLPDAFAVTATIAATSESDLDAGRFQILLQSLEGPSGGELFGRFCHADETLARQVRQHLAREEALDPTSVYAEIVHLPESRMTNILARPVLRACEIPYLGGSGARPEYQLPVADLWLSVEHEKLVLHSKRLGRPVVPRMTTAHNFSLSHVPVYRFLCALAHQDAITVEWNWGPLGQAPFLPRVSCGRLVFSRATWNLGKQELSRLNQPTVEQRFEAAQDLRADLRLPRWTVLWDGDNALPVDFDNCLSVENFVHLVHQRAGIVLTELYPGPDQLFVRGPEGRFSHELLVPFVRKAKATSKSETGNPTPETNPRPSPEMPQSGRSAEVFSPGSTWLFVKLYCGLATADYLLRELLSGLVEQAQATGWMDRWFFIRYGDPDWHLRLRFHGQTEKLMGQLVPALHALLEPQLWSGALARWQIDTYERETRRYGGLAGVEIAEALFEADSDAVLAMLRAAGSADAAVEQRWRLGVCGVDRLLSDLGLDLQRRLDVAKVARAAMASPPGADPEQEHQLSQDFRRERQILETLLRGELAPDDPVSVALNPLKARSVRLIPLCTKLQELQQQGRLSQSIEELSRSYIHMHINRLLRTRHREFELRIYDALQRLYESMIARRTRNMGNRPTVSQASLLVPIPGK